MSKDNKGKYAVKKKRQAHHIEEGYLGHGVTREEAQRRAWATVNKQYGGGKDKNKQQKNNGTRDDFCCS